MSDQNKQQNKLENIRNNPTPFNISDIFFLKDNPQLVYLYKKTEKLVSALYLLSSFISDKEPVKWQIREVAVSLLSLSIGLSDRTSSKQISTHFDFISGGLKLLSFLEISYLSGIISEMNFNILKYELCSLIQTVEQDEKGSVTKGLVFSDHFFDVPVPAQVLNPTPAFIDKGQNIMSDRLSFKKVSETVKTSELKQKDKSNRQDIIISLLKKNNELGIKDFTSSIKDCSEKTIQRELVLLVTKGLIKKDGEKRWSRYSLR